MLPNRSAQTLILALSAAVAAASGAHAQATTAVAASASAQAAPEYGPAKGALVIIGGGNAEGTGLMERFIELGGGPENGKFIIVPTAGGNRDGNGALRVYTDSQVVASWKRRGVKNVTMLHTADPAVANTEAFVKNLREATAVWFDGGRQWNIVDSYGGTLTERLFHEVLARGGVIGGTSAGASIQGDYLTRGDTKNNTIVMTAEKDHMYGFKFLRNVAIDQHINTRRRWDDLVQVIDSMPNMLGIGLSEGTGIVVQGDKFEVMGLFQVTIHDSTRPFRPWEKSYFVLEQGDAYDMKARRVTTLTAVGTPITPPARARPTAAGAGATPAAGRPAGASPPPPLR